MMMLVQESAKENLESQRIFGQLTDLLVQRHIEDCDDPLCICDEMENFYELMRFKHLNNSEVISLLRSERKRYKKIIDDQGLVGTVSSISDLTVKTHQSSESTLQHGLADQDRLSKKD